MHNWWYVVHSIYSSCLYSDESDLFIIQWNAFHVYNLCAVTSCMYVYLPLLKIPLQWCYNGRDGVSNHQPHDCLLNRLFRHRSKKISKFRVTGLCAGNSNVTGEFPVEMTSNAENVSIWWRHHVCYMWHAMFLWTFVYHRENKPSLFVYLFIDIIIVWLILPGLLITMCRITITMTS